MFDGTITSVEEYAAWALAQRLLAAELPRRWQHVQAVARKAGQLCDAHGLERPIVVSAAWLHDIGYASEVAVAGFHPLDGARYLRFQGWDDRVCRLVAHHTDAATHAGDLTETLIAEFETTHGLSSDILWAADATTGPSGERFTLDERLAEIAQRYGSTHQVTQHMLKSRRALQDAITRASAGHL